MPRKLSDGCKNYQNEARQKTIDAVQTAIDRLKEEGAIVTISKLMELTGYSRSTFSKVHVADVFKKNKVCKYQNRTVLVQEENNLRLVEELENELKKSNKLVTKLTQELERQKTMKLKIQADLVKRDEEHQLLLGKWHTLVKKAKLMGINNLDKIIN